MNVLGLSMFSTLSKPPSDGFVDSTLLTPTEGPVPTPGSLGLTKFYNRTEVQELFNKKFPF